MQRYLKNHCQKKGMTSTTVGEMINQLVEMVEFTTLHRSAHVNLPKLPFCQVFFAVLNPWESGLWVQTFMCP